jgi:hypothetical protein
LTGVTEVNAMIRQKFQFYQASMSEQFSAVIANGLSGFFVHLLDVNLQSVLLGERRAAHRTPVKKSRFSQK